MIDGKRGRGNPKKKWFEVIECNMIMSGVCEEDAKNRSKAGFTLVEYTSLLFCLLTLLF